MTMVAGPDFAPTRRVIARRIARISFGGALIFGALTIVYGVLEDWRRAPPAAFLLATSWLVALALGGIGLALARRVRWTRDPDFLLAPSVIVPMIGLALVLPLTLHLLVFAIADAAGSAFNEWVALSVLASGVAHLVLVLGVILRGRALVAHRATPTPGSIYAATVAGGAVPFIVFLLPPVIVAVTALPFLWLLRHMETVVERERAALAGAPRVPPRAVVI